MHIPRPGIRTVTLYMESTCTCSYLLCICTLVAFATRQPTHARSMCGLIISYYCAYWFPNFTDIVSWHSLDAYRDLPHLLTATKYGQKAGYCARVCYSGLNLVNMFYTSCRKCTLILLPSLALTLMSLSFLWVCWRCTPLYVVCGALLLERFLCMELGKHDEWFSSM